MEALAMEMRSWAIAGLAILLGGCLHLDGLYEIEEGPPTGPVCRIVATWTHHVIFTPDPANGGNPIPGIAGRLYLFGQMPGAPLAGDGSLVVDLLDARPEKEGGKPILLEQWRIDPATLSRLLRKDTIGWGYTLFLPWGTYKPEIDRVYLKVRYNPMHGTPLYADYAPLTLRSKR